MTVIIRVDEIIHVDRAGLMISIQGNKNSCYLKACPVDNSLSNYNFINRSAACSSVVSFFAKQNRSTLLLISCL
jgi:hypothetical protein